VKASPPAALVRAFDDVVGTLRGVERRKMFGYPAVFVNGNMFAGILRDKMVLRLSLADVETFLALPGATPFIAMGGRRMKQWAIAPPQMVKSPRMLRPWLARALAHGRSLPKKVRAAKAASASAGIRRIRRARR